MISQTVEYALRAVTTIAQHDSQPCTAQKISKITKVPAPYLSKLMQGLVRAGLAKSQRGVHGGFVLSRSAEELTIWDVVQAVEPFQRIRECPLGISSHGTNLCPLHGRLDNAMAMVERSFRETTVAELLAQPGSVTPLCEDNKVLTISGSSSATSPSAKRKSAKTKAAKKRLKK